MVTAQVPATVNVTSWPTPTALGIGHMRCICAARGSGARPRFTEVRRLRIPQGQGLSSVHRAAHSGRISKACHHSEVNSVSSHCTWHCVISSPAVGDRWGTWRAAQAG